MAIAGLVVLRGAALQSVGDAVQGDAALAGRVRLRGDHRHLQGVQRHPRVAVGDVDQVGQCFWFQLRRKRGQPPAFVRQRAVDDRSDGVVIQCAEGEHAAPGQERRVDLERRVLGGGADEGDGPVFDVRQDHVLLGFVEAVDLVNEQDGGLLVESLAFLGAGHRLAEISHAGRHCADRLEMRLRDGGDEPGQRSLAGARRSPEQDGRYTVDFYSPAQDPVFGKDMLLPHEFVEGGRSHPLCQRGRFPGALLAPVIEKAAGFMTCGHRWKL